MKKIIALVSLLVVLPCYAPVYSVVMPTYSDDLPQEYIDNYKNSKKVDYKQTLPLPNSEKSLEVKVYAPEKIAIKPVYERVDGKLVYHEQNGINSNVKFIVAEDVYKNGTVYIKKGTEAIGTVRNAQIGLGILTAPDEIQVSLFTTKDVNNKSVKLYGTILAEGKDYGLFYIGATSVRASIPKGKIYSLSAEK